MYDCVLCCRLAVFFEEVYTSFISFIIVVTGAFGIMGYDRVLHMLEMLVAVRMPILLLWKPSYRPDPNLVQLPIVKLEVHNHLTHSNTTEAYLVYMREDIAANVLYLIRHTTVRHFVAGNHMPRRVKSHAFLH